MTGRMTAADSVHARLRDAIVSGELKNGSLHSIYEMAERFGVSRTPVRDAVLRLADAGLLQIERNRGIRIRGLRMADVQAIFEARLLLEVPAAAAAARQTTPGLREALDTTLAALERTAEEQDLLSFTQHDRSLHRTLILASGNERVSGIVDSLRDATQVRGVSTLKRSRSLDEVRAEHEPIVAAVREGDAERAGAHMRRHLETTGLLLMQQVASATGEAPPSEWHSRLLD